MSYPQARGSSKKEKEKILYIFIHRFSQLIHRWRCTKRREVSTIFRFFHRGGQVFQKQSTAKKRPAARRIPATFIDTEK
jgi:hypothetical protein